LAITNRWFIYWFDVSLFWKKVVKGNNLILEEYENPKDTISILMAPLVLVSTLITHLFGGSAGREGTAVQMSSAIADQFTTLFKLDKTERKTILILGISAGFASVFGTPLTGAIFALEILCFKQINIKSILTSLLVAYIAFMWLNYGMLATLTTPLHFHQKLPSSIYFSPLYAGLHLV